MRKIGIFDSGVGGVSVLKEILVSFPFDNIVYFGDNLNAPYGDKEVEEIRSLALKVSDFLVYEQKVDVLVIACNTATGAAIHLMKERYDIPIIGVVENGVIDGLKVSKNKNIGVIATSATIKMDIYRKVAHELDKTVNIYGVPCPLLVRKIEKGWEDNSENNSILEEYLSQLPNNIDTLILGCTHYPLIKKYIQKYFNGIIIDPARETNESLKNIIGTGYYISTPTLKFFASGDCEQFKKIASEFLEKEILTVEKIIL
ncbi:MAG: glutamate racemase [Cetobacterium sp.]